MLVAQGRLQGAEVGDVGAYLDVVELLFVYVVGDVLPATAPRHSRHTRCAHVSVSAAPPFDESAWLAVRCWRSIDP